MLDELSGVSVKPGIVCDELVELDELELELDFEVLELDFEELELELELELYL